MAKIHWKVAEAATGRYRSFQHRSWPMGYSDKKENTVIANIIGEENYSGARVKTNDHKPLKVRLAIARNDSFDWKQLKGEFATLDDAKAAAQRFYDAHTELFRKD